MKGVNYNNQCRKWMARVVREKKRIYLGIFDTEQQAIEAVNEFKKTSPDPPVIERPKELTAEFARSRMNYDPETGQITWKHSCGEFLDGRGAGSNQVKPGSPVGNVIAGKVTFYIAVKINGKTYPAHRLAWLMHYGEWPKGQIDHVNGDGLDNRICNLRDVTGSENQRNRRLGRNNTSGFLGVRKQSPTSKRWGAYFAKITIGVFDTKQEAIDARKKYEQENGFHPNNGRVT